MAHMWRVEPDSLIDPVKVTPSDRRRADGWRQTLFNSGPRASHERTG
jgi:hypothetical protein